MIKKLLEKYSPLIQNFLLEYSKDYEFLQKNWKDMCTKMLQVNPQGIIILKEELDLESCEELTKLGFCIRRNTELIPCEVCNRALLSKEMYEYMKSINRTEFIPDIWNSKCQEC